jgi:predicted NAD-dependent protein-ADP-ribosyltransferase YbiA (DUF1768 family)
MTLTIQSVEDVPYGKLEFNHPDSLVHGGREWKSAAHYALSNMFSDQLHAKAVASSTCENIFEVYSENKKKQFFQTTSIAIRQAIEARLQDKSFAQSLLATKDAKIVYESRNSLMGSGTDGFGKNVFGEWLEFARSSISGKQCLAVPDNRETAIYNAYVNTKLLIPLLRQHDLQIYIDKNFLRMSDLLKQLICDVGTEAYRKLPDKETILTIHKNLNVDYCTNPTSLIKFVRRKYFRDARATNERRLMFAIFDLFIESVAHLYSTEPVNRVSNIANDKQTMDFKTMSNLVSRTYALFQSKSLPPAVQRKAEAVAETIYLPPLAKIEMHERETFKQHAASEKPGGDGDTGSGHRYFVSSDSELGPAYVSEFSVNNRRFPTVGHYINFMYMCMFSDPTTSYSFLWNARKKSWRSLFDIAKLVEKVIAESHDRKLSNLINEILATKCQNESVHQLLLSTCGRQIETKHVLYSSSLNKFRDRLSPRVHTMTSVENVLAVEPFRKLIVTLSLIFDSTKSNARTLAGGFDPSSKRIVESLFGFDSENSSSQTLFLHSDPVMNSYLEALTTKCLSLKYDLLLASFIYKRQESSSVVTKISKSLSFVVDSKDNACVVALCRLCALLQALAGGPIDQNVVNAASRTLRLSLAPDDDATNENVVELESDSDAEAMDDDDETIISGDDNSQEEEPDDPLFYGSGKIRGFLEDISDAVISEYIEDMLLESVVGLRSSWSLSKHTIITFFCNLPLEIEV